jgi:predicted phosphodiesterase
MRILATSDVHIDKNGEETLNVLVEFAKRAAPDVIVLAGDVATSPTTFLQTLLALRPCASTMLCVAGNHDVWSHPERVATGQHAWWRLDQLLPALCTEAGVHCLDAGGTVIDGVGFVGTLGWYDHSMRDPTLDAPEEAYHRGEFAGLRWMDHVYAVFPDETGRRLTAPAVAERLRARLAAQLRACPAERIVGVTHMVPFREQLHHKPHPGWRFCQAFIGHAGLGELFLADERVKLTIAGHTHLGSDLRLGGLRAVCAPLGYRGEWGGQGPAEAVARTVKLIEV